MSLNVTNLNKGDTSASLEGVPSGAAHAGPLYID